MFNRAELESAEFSWQKALALAMASQLAYLKNPAGVTYVATQTWGFERCEAFDVANTQGFVAWDSHVVLISFRGTECVGDWLSNLDLLSIERSYGKLHRGFLFAYEVARPAIAAILAKADPAGKRVWITGHSLGGALAMVAAAESLGSLAVSGIYTYGQPKTGNAAVRLFFQQNFAGRFHRFVNDDDIVPKVPPHYSHVGRLIWFDRRGDLKRFEEGGEAEVEIEATSARPPEMSEAEFHELQRQLQEIKAVTGGGTEAFESSVEGIFPSVSDHFIANYINAIRRHAESRVHVGPLLEAAIEIDLATRSGVETVTRSLLRAPQSPVLLQVKRANWQPPTGVAVQSRLGNILTARASLRAIQALRLDADVISVETSREAGMTELAQSGPFVHATDVHAPQIDERGDSALVALIDTGVDVLHKAFRDGAGKTRIVAVWDQKAASAGRSPKGVDGAVYTQSYGRLYDAGEIEKMIAGAATPLPLRDPQQHGTHVASIAAGRATGQLADGMAPESRIIVVIPDVMTDPGDPPSIGYSNSHVDALQFIRATAEKMSLPVAVNVSLGMNAGAHDGSSTLEAAFDQFSGIGRDPGFVVVKSAGNERGYNGHASASAMLGGISQIVWTCDSTPRDSDYIEVWFSGLDDIAFTLLCEESANKVHRSGAVSAVNPKDSSDLGGNHCQMTLTRNHRDNGDNLLVIQILPDTQLIHPGPWRLEMLGVALPGGGEVHAWVERDGRRAVSFQSGDNDEMTLSIPGTARTVITVGACESSMPLRLTDSSSWGLTRDGRAKPDVCAPGKAIIAAAANTNDLQATTAKTGTSMAAPHVTGAIALLMSRLQKDSTKKQVNAQQVQTALIRSGKNFTGRHNKGFGFGALDALDFLQQF